MSGFLVIKRINLSSALSVKALIGIDPRRNKFYYNRNERDKRI